jgi:hypothetical protein
VRTHLGSGIPWKNRESCEILGIPGCGTSTVQEKRTCFTVAREALSRAGAALRLNASSKCHEHQKSLLIASNIYLMSNRPSGAWQWPVRSSAYQFYKVTKRPRCPRIGRLPCYELSSSYPPGSSSRFPLKFDVEVVKNAPPSAGQICTILGNLPPVRDVEDPHHVAADDRMTTGSVQRAPGR